MKTSFLHVFLVLALASLACTITLPASRTTETRTFSVNEPAPAAEPAALNLNMIGGSLTLTGGSSSYISGTIEYNVPEWEPQVAWDENALTISQRVDTVPFPEGGTGVENRWNLQLGSTPMALAINAGVYTGTLNLSGVPITELSLSSAAGSTEVHFDSPNPVVMNHFEYRAATSSEAALGLGNANFDTFNFRGGAGSYHLDFSGTLQRAATATISGAAGDLTIEVPATTQAQVTVTGGLRDIDATGGWTTSENTYTNNGNGPLLTINIQMSIGRLKLVNK